MFVCVCLSTCFMFEYYLCVFLCFIYYYCSWFVFPSVSCFMFVCCGFPLWHMFYDCYVLCFPPCYVFVVLVFDVISPVVSLIAVSCCVLNIYYVSWLFAFVVSSMLCFTVVFCCMSHLFDVVFMRVVVLFPLLCVLCLFVVCVFPWVLCFILVCVFFPLFRLGVCLYLLLSSVLCFITDCFDLSSVL